MHVAVEGIVETLRGVPPARFQPGEVCARLRGILLDARTLSPYLHFARGPLHPQPDLPRRGVRAPGALLGAADAEPHPQPLRPALLAVDPAGSAAARQLSQPRRARAWRSHPPGSRRRHRPGAGRSARPAARRERDPPRLQPVSRARGRACTSIRARSTPASRTTSRPAPRARCACSIYSIGRQAGDGATCSEASLPRPGADRLRPWETGERGHRRPCRPRSAGRGARRALLAPFRRGHLASEPRRQRPLRLGGGGGGQLVPHGEAGHARAMPRPRPLPAVRRRRSPARRRTPSARRPARPDRRRCAHRHLELHHRRSVRAGPQPLGLLRPRRRLPGAPRHRAEGRRVRRRRRSTPRCAAFTVLPLPPERQREVDLLAGMGFWSAAIPPRRSNGSKR